ncbi:MAG: GNAT family N-acetyltransferase [Stackebrandtia sp.]
MTPIDVTFRLAVPADHRFLETMLIEAADWQHDDTDPDRPARVLSDEKVSGYIAGWPRPGDLGVVAQDARDVPAGACWLRRFTPQAPAFGFVAPEVPELTIGIAKPWRGKGIGRSLIRRVCHLAADNGIDRVSLSVDLVNPAIGLYRGEGFVAVETRRGAATMVKSLTATDSRLPHRVGPAQLDKVAFWAAFHCRKLSSVLPVRQ